MIPKVAHLIDNLFAVIILGSNNSLGSFLHNLLQNLVLAFIEQVVRIRTFYRVQLTIFDDIIEVIEDGNKSV